LTKFFNDNLVPAFRFFADLIKNYLVPIVTSIAIPIFDGLRKIFEIISAKVEENRDKFVKLGEFLKDFFLVVRDRVAPIIGTVLKVAFDILGKAIGPVIDLFFGFMSAFAEVGKFVIKVADGVLGVIEAMVNGIISGVNFAIKALNLLPGVDIDPIGNITINLPSFSAPTAPTTPGFDAPGRADRIDTPGTISTPGLTIPDLTLPGGGGGGGGGGRGGGGGGGRGGGGGGGGESVGIGLPDQTIFSTPQTNALTLFGNAERIAAMESARASQAAPVNITVNTVTADANLPNLIVESLQRYNLISGPVDVQIAV
jgi:hypothetical protein